jgi:uncharacterized HAD superfamily protein
LTILGRDIDRIIQIMMIKNQTVSIDFDGVIIEKVLGVDWASQTKTRLYKNGLKLAIYRFIDVSWSRFNHRFRKPIEGSKEGLLKLKDKGYRLVLITSRKGYMREITFEWMKRWGYYDLFDDFYFNDMMIGSVDSKVENVGKVKPVMHVDDNWETVSQLATLNPDKKLIFLNIGENFELHPNIIRVKSWNDVQI